MFDIQNSVDYTKLSINPIFEPIMKMFEFYLLGVGFIGMPEFQAAFLEVHPGMRPLINNFNQNVSLEKKGNVTKLSTKFYYIFIGRIMAIAIFDFLRFSKYNNKISNTEIYRFTKHIRNGAAHDNIFTFEGKNPKTKKARWNEKIILNSLEGKNVFPDFITTIDLIYLMSDLSKLFS